MKRQWILTAMLAAAGAGGLAQQPAPAAAVKARISLADGSQLTGTLTAPSLELAAEFGKLTIPFAQVATLEFVKGKARVGLANKDVLTGALGGEAFELETVFGKVQLPYPQIKSITFTGTPQAAKPAAADAPQPPPQAPNPMQPRRALTPPEPPEGKVWLKIEYPKPPFH